MKVRWRNSLLRKHSWSARPFRLLVLLTIFAVPIVQALLSSAPGAVQAQTAWTQIWSDEFNGAANTGVNTANWLYDIGTSYPGGAPNWGTGEIETMTNSTANVYHTGTGRLAIKPIRGANGGWTSGRIETQRTDFQPASGGVLRVEASIQVPNVTGAAAQGYWPAFWMLGAPFRGVYTNWPMVGEIDILENINGANQVWGTLHCGVSPGGPCNETSGIGGTRVMGSPSLQTAFHTYAMEWDKSVSPQQMRWYVDGIHYHTVNQNQVDATTWANATNHGFFLILNVAIGGGWPGNPTASTVSGVPMLIEYVRVFHRGGSGTNPTPTPVPNPTPTPPSSTVFTQGVENVSSTQARVWFKPNGWTAGYVILHYIRPGLAQQNVQMTYNSSTARWEYIVSSLGSGQVLQTSFTYQRSGLQYDTGWYSWTKP